MSEQSLKELSMQSLRALESEVGILASGREEAYGCLFGRDALISSLELLRAYEHTPDPLLLSLVEKSLRTLSNLQGRFVNLESGEEPGKIVHEYRPERHEHLTALAENPWYVYPEGVMRNYDSVDSTALFLIAVHEYKKVGDERVVVTLMPSVRAALSWLKENLRTYGGFLRYRFDPERKHGGLKVQSWMDSSESLFFEESDEAPLYPIAPLEAQAYAWKALAVWGEERAAKALKARFNKSFVKVERGRVSLPFALDGEDRPLTSARSSMGHVLWAAHNGECILESEYIPGLRKRLMATDLFVPQAGMRTLSSRSRRFDAMSYHNGSIWPHDTSLLMEGLENFGYMEDAERVRGALLRAYRHFKTPVELYTWRRGLRVWESATGQRACQVQAWSAASLLALLKPALVA